MNPQDIEKLANLSRIKLSDEEKIKYAKEIDSILAYVNQLKEVAGSAPEVSKSSHINVLRDDSVFHESGIHTEDLLSASPDRDGQYIKVKQILS